MAQLYFVCEWGSTPKAWLTPIECTAEHVGQIKWRGTKDIVNLHYTETFNTCQKAKPPAAMYAILKSSLQKQVRRQKVSAVTTFRKMLALDSFETLRRLAIIAAEDAEISVETAIVVWLMAATSKGLQLEKHHIVWLEKYVYALVLHPVCQRLEINAGTTYLTVDRVHTSDHPDAEIIAAVLLRTAYGGLKCDPLMLASCLDWYLTTGTRLQVLTKNCTLPITKLAIHPAAVDFHVYPKIISLLHEEFPEYNEEQLTSAIWECSSGINVRKKVYIPEKVRKCWDEIEESFRKLGKVFLKNNMQ